MDNGYRIDGAVMRNQLLGIGVPGVDAELHNTPGSIKQILPQAELEALDATDGIAQKVVRLIPDTAAAGGIDVKIEGKSLSEIDNAIEDLDLCEWMAEALQLSRLYYGSDQSLTPSCTSRTTAPPP